LNKRFTEILKVVRSLCRPPIDTENLASEIWCGEVLANRKVTYIEIRNLCYDELRKLQTRCKHDQSYASLLVERRESFYGNFDPSVLCEVLEGSEVPTVAKLIVFRKYYLGESMEQVAKELSLSLPEVYFRHSRVLETLRNKLKEKE
jgi:DNA-directed RNA polymerase specialized sigma24 family protein